MLKSTNAEAPGQAGELHQKLTREAVDPTWSTGVEPLIRDYLANHLDSHEIQVQSVECRSTLCEVQLITPHATTPWPNLADMSSQPWWSTYDLTGEPFIVAMRFNDSRPVLLAYVSRGTAVNRPR